MNLKAICRDTKFRRSSNVMSTSMIRASPYAFNMPPLAIASHLFSTIRHSAGVLLAAFAIAANASPLACNLMSIHKRGDISISILRSSSYPYGYTCTAPVVVFDKDYKLRPSSFWQTNLEGEEELSVADKRAATATNTSPEDLPTYRGSSKAQYHNVLQRGSSLSSYGNLLSEVRILTRLLVALVVGGVIGMERRAANSLAGVRTFSLVSLGAAVFMSTTLVAFPNSDPARVAAAISSSVGFLGAGAMYKNSKPRGLTTASSVWLAAALGIAAASGMFLLSFTGAISTVLIARYARFDSSLQLIRGDPTSSFIDGSEDEKDDDDEVGSSNNEKEKRFYRFDEEKEVDWKRRNGEFEEEWDRNEMSDFDSSSRRGASMDEGRDGDGRDEAK